VRWLAALLLAALPAAGPTWADVAQDAFVAVFWHEAAHALIDVLPIAPGASEEDTADALSVWLIARLFPADRAAALVEAQAAMFAAHAARGEVPARGGHAADAARAARLPCLLAGAAGPCAAEWAGLSAGFAAALEGRPPQDHGPGLRLVRGDGGVAAAVAAFNAEFGLPRRADVVVEPCGAPDAFYDPRARRVVMCTEFADGLARLLGR
jgi:hypothetical protein